MPQFGIELSVLSLRNWRAATSSTPDEKAIPRVEQVQLPRTARFDTGGIALAVLVVAWEGAMRHTYAAFAGTLVLLGWPAGARADSISIVHDFRFMAVLASVQDGNVSDRHTDNSQPPGDSMRSAVAATTGTSSASAVATLVSSISDPAHLSGRGTATGQASINHFGDFSASPTFAVDFHLTEPHSFTFASTFTTSAHQMMPPGPPNVRAGANWQASLTSGFLTWFNRFDTGPATVTATGALPIGDFHLFLDSGATGTAFRAATLDAASGFDFTFDLTPMPGGTPSPTPEPASMILFATGVLGAVGIRHRQSQRDTPPSDDSSRAS